MDRKYNFFAGIEFIFGYYEYLGQNTSYMFCIAKSDYVALFLGCIAHL